MCVKKGYVVMRTMLYMEQESNWIKWVCLSFLPNDMWYLMICYACHWGIRVGVGEKAIGKKVVKPWELVQSYV
jgi:hypothetical protein